MLDGKTRGEWDEAAEAVFEEVVALRRAIHAEPEIGLHCPLTSAKIKAALAGLPLEVREGTSTTGFVAILRGGAAAAQTDEDAVRHARSLFMGAERDDPKTSGEQVEALQMSNGAAARIGRRPRLDRVRPEPISSSASPE